MSNAAALVVPAVKRHTATVIMAHGLGDTGAGWVSLAENWRRRQKFDEVKFIFPNAPVIPITVVSLYASTDWKQSLMDMTTEWGYANAGLVRYSKTSRYRAFSGTAHTMLKPISFVTDLIGADLIRRPASWSR